MHNLSRYHEQLVLPFGNNSPVQQTVVNTWRSVWLASSEVGILLHAFRRRQASQNDAHQCHISSDTEANTYRRFGERWSRCWTVNKMGCSHDWMRMLPDLEKYFNLLHKESSFNSQLNGGVIISIMMWIYLTIKPLFRKFELCQSC